MKVLFIQGGSRCKEDEQGNWYTDSNFDEKVWKRYKSYCDNLTVILRKEEKKYTKKYSESHFNKFPSNIKLVTVKDIYKQRYRKGN